eukprot:726073_1
MSVEADVIDPIFMVQRNLRLRKYDDCIEMCDKLLQTNPLDQAAWYLKVRALIGKDYIDDTELEEEGIADILMNEDAVAKAPRPGTSLKRPMTGSGGTNAPNQGMRPMTGLNRPITGFARPGTSSRSQNLSVSDAFKGNRPGTSRPLSVAGRYVRLGTASLQSGSDKFIDVDRLDIRKCAKKPALSKAMLEYLFYCEFNTRKAMELAAEATKSAGFQDWWWKMRLGQCYYKLGMLRDAEKQFQSSLKQQEMIETYLMLAKVYIRLDQPKSALDTYLRGYECFPGEVSLILGRARIFDMLNDVDGAIKAYNVALDFDASNVEAIASLASHYFYSDQPEIALRQYRRLLQVVPASAMLHGNPDGC